jgi:hypothetical protein
VISEFEARLIRQAAEQPDFQRSVQAARDSTNPFFLGEFVAAHNFDDPEALAVVRAAIDNPRCDLGTALSIFWLLEGLGVVTGEIARDEYNAAWFDLAALLAQRLEQRHYAGGPVAFTPPLLNKLQEHKLRVAGVSVVLFEPVTAAQEPT